MTFSFPGPGLKVVPWASLWPSLTCVWVAFGLGKIFKLFKFLERGRVGLEDF